MKKIELFIVGKKTKVKLDVSENPTYPAFWVTFVLLFFLGAYLSFPVLVSMKLDWNTIKLFFGICIYSIACYGLGSGMILLKQMKKIKKEKTVEDELDLPKQKPL